MRARSQTQIKGKIFEVNPALVRRYKDQPREYFDENELDELQFSIKEEGQITPVPVTKVEDDSKHGWQLLDGERRWIVAQRLGVKLIVFETNVVDEDDRFAKAFAVNFGRAEHTPMEIARAIDRIFNSKKMADLGK